MDDESRYFRIDGRVRVAKAPRKRKPSRNGPDWRRIIAVLLFLWLVLYLMQHGRR
jgi:hypothetical protein